MTWLLGLAIGLLMGVTGAGGGVLAVPALVFGLGLSMQQAAPIAMVAVSCAAWIGAIEGLGRGVVRWRAALVIAMAAWPCASAGVLLAQRLPDLALRIVFIATLAFVAWRQVASLIPRTEAEALPATAHVAVLSASTGRFVWNARAWFGFSGIGGVMGFMSGLLGVSGGFVLVPLLSRRTPLNAPMLVGTSLMVSALVTGFGAAFSAYHGATPPWSTTAWFSLSLVLGVLVGRMVVRRLPERWVRWVFVGLVVVVAAGMTSDVLRRLLER